MPQIAQTAGRIVAIGGVPFGDAGAEAKLLAYVLAQARVERPRVLHLATATGDNDWMLMRFYEMFSADACRPSHLRFFSGPPESGWHRRVLEQDVIWVGGGNTANLLAVWRAQGFDRVVREAWEAGAVLAGWSAGAICWFECSVTDSFRAELDGMRDGLGLLAGSCCPHFDGEPRRRPLMTKLVSEGFPAGFGIDDGAAMLFAGQELTEVVTAREGATAHRLQLRGGEVSAEPLPARCI